MIYLDYAASTPLDPRVVSAMSEVLQSPVLFGNPSSLHQYGWQARELIGKAREQVANAIGASSKEIIWTSGATESNNLAIKGAAYVQLEQGLHLISMQTEHASVLDPFKQLEEEGFEVTYLAPQLDGLLDLETLKKALRSDTTLVSIMQVNNETGVIQPIKEIAEIVKTQGALFHVDAAQSIGKVALNVKELAADLISLSAHKVYGPKGVGALYVRRFPRVKLSPLLHGGGQEQGLRSGTLPTHQIVGMGEAFRIAQEEAEADQLHITRLGEKFRQGLKKIKGLSINGNERHSVPNIVNITCQGVNGDLLMAALEPDLALSRSSACMTAVIEPSHVLLAMGLSAEHARSSLRFSFGRFTTEAEIEKVLSILEGQLARLSK